MQLIFFNNGVWQLRRRQMSESDTQKASPKLRPQDTNLFSRGGQIQEGREQAEVASLASSVAPLCTSVRAASLLWTRLLTCAADATRDATVVNPIKNTIMRKENFAANSICATCNSTISCQKKVSFAHFDVRSLGPAFLRMQLRAFCARNHRRTGQISSVSTHQNRNLALCHNNGPQRRSLHETSSPPRSEGGNAPFMDCARILNPPPPPSPQGQIPITLSADSCMLFILDTEEKKILQYCTNEMSKVSRRGRVVD